MDGFIIAHRDLSDADALLTCHNSFGASEPLAWSACEPVELTSMERSARRNHWVRLGWAPRAVTLEIKK
jgi:hypothetical protein